MGCDCYSQKMNTESWLFQSTHPHGVRLDIQQRFFDVMQVSIHAPTWGATQTSQHLIVHKWFQSTHPHGVRHATGTKLNKSFPFQSTHPHGVRHKTCSTNRPLRRFNPRTHMGCDISTPNNNIVDYVSIHAPTWGATSMFNHYKIRQEMFQSTHPHGVRLSLHLCRLLPVRFNPRTHMGCDMPSQPLLTVSKVSIHAPTWGATFCRAR